MGFTQARKIGTPSRGANKNISGIKGYYELGINKTGPGGNLLTMINLQNTFTPLELSQAWGQGKTHAYISLDVSIDVFENNGGSQILAFDADYESHNGTTAGPFDLLNGPEGQIFNPDQPGNCGTASGSVVGLVPLIRPGDGGFTAQNRRMLKRLYLNSAYTGVGCSSTANFIGRLIGFI